MTVINAQNNTYAGPFVPDVFDYVDANLAGATTDIYTYKIGGASGIVVATITVTWTTSSKDVLDYVTKT
jgi:hypothetical protein